MERPITVHQILGVKIALQRRNESVDVVLGHLLVELNDLLFRAGPSRPPRCSDGHRSRRVFQPPVAALPVCLHPMPSSHERNERSTPLSDGVLIMLHDVFGHLYVSVVCSDCSGEEVLHEALFEALELCDVLFVR